MAENSRVTNGANLVALLALSEPWPIARSDWFGNGPALPQAALAASRHDAAQPPLATFTWGNSASLAAKPANGIAALSLTADAPATAPSLTAPQSPLGSAGTASSGNPAAAESVSAGNAAAVNAPAAAIPVDWPPSTTTGPPAPDMSRPAGAGSSGATAVAGPEPVAAAAISPAPSVSFPGASFATNQTMPPDSNIAVGLTQVVTTENSRIQWYDRSGKLQSDNGLSAFFGLPVGTPMVDTRVVYDSVNNRFVVVSDQVQDHILRLAVSKDSDPNHGWWFAGINGQVTVNGQNTWADFPGLATDGKAIYITARMNTFGPDGVINTGDETFAETHLWIVNDGIGANGIYDGGSLLVSDFGANAVTGGSTNNFGQPAQILSPTGGSLGTFLVNATITGRVQITRIDNATTAPSFQSQNLVGAPSVSFPLVANQPGTFAQIEAHTVGNAVWRNGALYAVGVIGPATGPNFGLPTAHWYKIDTSNLASLSLVDQGDVGGSLLGSGPGVATFQPMISADPAGDFLVNFSASGPGLFAGAYYAVHTTADAAGTVETPQALHVGQDSYALADSAGDIRWGDYSGIAADPANPNTVWVFNQYAAPRGPGQTGNWATQAAAVPLVPGPMPLAGGRWVFSPPAGFGGLILGINNGAAPIFPPPVAGAFNIEVFTSPSLSGQPGIPNPDANFQSSIADPGGTLDSGFLTGTDLRLTTGDLLLVDSVTGSTSQSASKLTLGSGNQTVVGARSDTLVGGSGNQILSALAGSETVVGGTGNVSVWGGANDSIVGGTGANQQIVLTGSLTTVVGGMAGNATIASAAQDTILSLGGSTQNIVIAGGVNSLVDLTGNSGLDAVIGATGDTIVAGAGTTNVEGVNGGMLIVVGAAGTTNISGSGVPGLGNTITGGSGNLDFNPSAQPGQGDLFNLSGSTGNATINAFGFGSARIASPDTILAGNGADSVFGGGGDRIGTGNGPSVGGVHLWDHSDPLAGASLAFGSNDTVASTAYNTAAHTATRHPEIAGSSTAVVTVTNFSTATDSLFYQNENTATTDAIIATSQAATIAGAASTVLTLPDGTLMTLVGITQAQLIPALFKP